MQRIVKCAPLDFQEATLLCIDMAPGERYTDATEFYAGKGKNTSAPAPAPKTPAAPAPAPKTPAAPAPAAKTTAAKTPAGKGAKDMLAGMKNSADSLGVTDMATGVLDAKKEEVKQKALTEAGAQLNKAKDKVPILEQSSSAEVSTDAPAPVEMNESAENEVAYAEEDDWEEDWGEEGEEEDGEYAEEEYKYVYYFY